MQFNSNLLQSVLGQTKGAKATSGESSNTLVSPVQGGVSEASSEFLSLLNETKAIAESGVTSEEFIETLNTEELGLTGTEKKALAKSFIEAVDAKSQTQVSTEILPEASVAVGSGSTEELLSKIQGGSKSNVVKLPTGHELPKGIQGTVSLTDKLPAEEVSKSVSNVEILEEKINPKITNGKLISLKEHSAKTVSPGSFQSSEDFVAQAKVIADDTKEIAEASEKRSFFPNSKSKVLAFNKEQNTINNNIFSGKNPFITESKPTHTQVKNDSTLTSIEGLNTNSQMEVVAPVLTQSSQWGNGNQTAFGNQSNVKVLDFSNINTANTEQLIDKISNYITTSRLEKQEHVELVVKHNSLGQIKVTASKGQLPDQINLDIVANSDKGHQFFKSNEVEMIKSLSNSGVKLNDVKISMGSEFNLQSSDKGERQFNQGHGSQNSRQDGQQASSNSEQGRRDRREQMWSMYRERLGA